MEEATKLHQFFFSNPRDRQALSELGIHWVDLPPVNEKDQTALASSNLPEPYTGMTLGQYFELIHPEDKQRILAAFDALRKGESKMFRETYRLIHPDGSVVWIKNHTTIIDLEGTQKRRVLVGTNVNVTEHLKTENQLRVLLSRERKQRIEVETLRQVAAAISASLNMEETVKRILEETRRIIPYDSGTVEIVQPDRLKIIGGYGFDNIAEVLNIYIRYPDETSLSTKAVREKRTIMTNDVAKDFPVFNQPHKDKVIHSWMAIPLVRFDEVIGLMALDSFKPNAYSQKHVRLAELVGVHVAIALENARLHEEAYQMAMEDFLTGLGSRHRFQMEGRILFESARRSADCLGIIMMDIDFFKKVNDEFGHPTGDEVLKRIALVLKNNLRGMDLIARYGGEEFLAILPSTSEEETFSVAEKLRTLVEQLDHPEFPQSVTVSAGCFAGIPGSHDTLDGFVSWADKALYRSKAEGRNRTTVLP
jgi:diguanylate cyclase (GGDEF)-like protein